VEAFLYALGFFASFVAGAFFGLTLFGSVARAVEAKWVVRPDDEDDDSEAWKRGR
jgi:hypothetical protein